MMVPCKGAEERAGREAQDDGDPPRQRVGRPQGHGRTDRGVVADGQVDLAEQQDEDLGHAQQDERDALDHQVDQVARGQEQVAAHLEEDDDRDQAQDDGQRAALTVSDPLDPDTRVLTHRVGDQLRRPGHYRIVGRVRFGLVGDCGGICRGRSGAAFCR
jgi:hypothetical protein